MSVTPRRHLELAPREPSTRAITARDGASVEVREDEAGERLRVLDREGGLLFEYEPGSGKARLHVPAGDLEIAAPRGHIDLVAGGRVRCFAGGEVSFDSPAGVSLRAHAPGHAPAGVRVRPGSVDLGADDLRVSAKRGQFQVADGKLEATSFSVVVERAHALLGTFESVAERVLARSKNLYQRVAELHEVKVGRQRTIARGPLDIQAETASIQTTGDVRIDGERINLG